MADVITLGGTGLTSTGWFVVRTSGLDDAPSLALATASLPQRSALIATSSWRQPSAREAVVTVGLLADDLTELATGLRALQALLPGDGIVLTHSRRSAQRLRVYLTGAPASYGPGPEALAPFYLELGLRVTAPDPYWEDASEQSVAFTTTATAIPQGLADSRGVITIEASGASVINPTITYLDSTGASVASIQPTITIAAGDAFKIDTVLGQVRKRVSGTWSNAITTLPDSFSYPIFRRSHWDYAASDWPTLAVTAGNGTVTYRRRWP